MHLFFQAVIIRTRLEIFFTSDMIFNLSVRYFRATAKHRAEASVKYWLDSKNQSNLALNLSGIREIKEQTKQINPSTQCNLQRSSTSRTTSSCVTGSPSIVKSAMTSFCFSCLRSYDNNVKKEFMEACVQFFIIFRNVHHPLIF